MIYRYYKQLLLKKCLINIKLQIIFFFFDLKFYNNYSIYIA